MIGSSIVLLTALTGQPAIPARTQEAKTVIAQNYGTGIATIGLSFTTANQVIHPLDWTSSFDSVWNFEDSPGITSDSGTVGDTLTNNGSITNTADSSVQGNKAAVLVSDGTQWFSLADGGNTDQTGYGDFSALCWVYWTSDLSTTQYVISKSNTGSTVGWGAWNRPSADFQHRAGAWHQTAQVTASSVTNTGGTCTSNACVTPVNNIYYGDVSPPTCSAGTECVAWQTNTWVNVGVVVRGSASGLIKLINNGQSVSSSTADMNIPDNSETFKIGYNVSGNGVGGLVDECAFDDAELTNTEMCRICSLGIAGQRGECDPANQANYKPCNSNSDCFDNLCVTIATEDNCSPGGSAGCCMGYNDWDRFGLNCNDCDLPACNATRS